MSDFETIRAALWYIDAPVELLSPSRVHERERGIEALDRLEAELTHLREENERLRKALEECRQILADARNREGETEDENERLREEKAGLWRDREAFVEREVHLREENERLRVAQAEAWDEVEVQRREVERLRELTDYLRNGEVDVDEQEREYARLRRIEEAMERIVAIDHMRLGWGEEIQRIARAVLADQPTEEKLTPSQELMYAEDGYDQPTEEEA